MTTIICKPIKLKIVKRNSVKVKPPSTKNRDHSVLDQTPRDSTIPQNVVEEGIVVETVNLEKPKLNEEAKSPAPDAYATTHENNPSAILENL